MSNIEVRYSVYFKKDRAQRFYPSTFCGSTFDILRFAFPEVLRFAVRPRLVSYEHRRWPERQTFEP